MHSWEWSGDRLPFPCWEIIAFKVRGKEFSLFLLLYEWCQTLISSGYNVLSFKYDVLINANCIMVFGTSYNATKGSHRVLMVVCQFWKQKPPRGGKMIIFWNFLDPSSPRLASGSPGPWNTFNLKQPTHLGELILSSWSNQLAWASFPCPKWLFL